MAFRMLMRNKPFRNIIFLSLLGLTAACSLNEPETSSGYPVQLQAEKNLSLVKLSWPAVKVTGFKEYILLQSSTEIPPSSEPEITANVTVAKRIDDAEVTSFFASDILFSPKVCYKLYVSIDDRFLQSQNICVEQEYKIIDGFYDRASHELGLDEIVMYDRVNQSLSSYNYKEEIFTSGVTNVGFSFPILSLSSYEGVASAFIYDQSPARMAKYRFPDLSSTAYRDFGGFLYAVQPYKQFLFAATEEFGKSFKVLSRSNLADIDNESGLQFNRNIAVFEGDPTIVLEAGDNGINRYAVDAQGKLTFLDYKTPGLTQPSTQNTTAQGTDIFIGGRFGTIINRQGEVLTTLQSSFNSFVMMTRLSEDESKIAYIASDNINIKLEIGDISNPEHVVSLGSFNLPSANYSDMIIEDGVIYLFGVSFTSGQAESFILKYPML